MYTQCPECQSIYQPLGAELAAARGHVCCGHCAAVFDALLTLTEELPPEPIGRFSRHEDEDQPPVLSRALPRGSEWLANNPFFDPDALQAEPAPPPVAPQFARASRPTRPAHNGRWMVACGVLSLALAAQIGWSERDWLAAKPQLRPWLERACASFGCVLPLRRDDHLMQLVSRDIRPHPSVAGALIISASLHNEASFAQPFPQIGITLSDLESRRVAMRRFQPQEYIGESQTLQAGLAPGTSIAVVFEVADPGQDAVAFEFSFN